jgi:hypothetical protein
MEQVAHGIDKDHLWLFPIERFFMHFRACISAIYIVGCPIACRRFATLGVQCLQPGLIFVQPVKGFQVDSVHSIPECSAILSP